MREIVYDLDKFLERVDKSKPIHYIWRLSFDYWSRLAIVFEASGKARGGDYSVIFIRKEEVNIDDVVNEFVEKCRKELEEKVKKPLEWGRWE